MVLARDAGSVGDEAVALLGRDEVEPPVAVVQTVRFLTARGVWHRLSRNAEARSCRDAARKRRRLGHVGIPLRDEMKSYFARVDDSAAPRYVMAHCRGDRQLDLDVLAAVVGTGRRLRRLTHEELAAFGLTYGLVNPFEHWEPNALDGRFIHAPVLQVFDEDLLHPLGTPGTVMTNAGDLTWAVELRAEELFAALLAPRGDAPAPRRAAIATPEEDAPPRPPHLTGRRSIAIITGNAPESGIALWNEINGHVRRLLGSDNVGDASMPPMHVVSLPELGMTMELDRRADHVWARLAPVIEKLCGTDTAMLAIACNTTQFFAGRIRAICDPAGVCFVSLPEVVAAWLAGRRVGEVALVGIPYVADLGAGWSGYEAPLRELKVEQLEPATLDRLVELAYRVKAEGPTHHGLNQLRAILNQGVRSSHVVLALTELSVLLALQRKAGRSHKTLIDPVELYAEALARRWMGLPFPAPPDWSVQLTGATHPAGAHDGAPARGNEDGVLLGSRVLTTQGSAATAEPAAHQQLCDVGGETEQREPLVVAVADGLGAHVAGAQASQLVLTRLRDASARLDDPDRIQDLLDETARALERQAARANDPAGARRGATAAGFVLIPPRDGEGHLDAIWFSVGDCVLLALELAAHAPGAVYLRLLCEPAVSPDGKPNRALGADSRSVPYTGRIRVREDALLLCCTDGFVTGLGIAVDSSAGERLAELPALRPTWEGLLYGSGDPEDDRRAVEALCLAAVRGGGRADDVSLAVIRARPRKEV